LVALLEWWPGIRLKWWLMRAWTIDERDISIRYGRQTIHSSDLNGRNSAFWRLEHFLEHLINSLPLVQCPRCGADLADAGGQCKDCGAVVAGQNMG
jgi:phage terminase large subunit-like protein